MLYSFSLVPGESRDFQMQLSDFCIALRLDKWMISNRLKLNVETTQLAIYGLNLSTAENINIAEVMLKGHRIMYWRQNQL